MELHTFFEELSLDVSTLNLAQFLNRQSDTFFWLDTSTKGTQQRNGWSYLCTASGPHAFTLTYSLHTQTVSKNRHPFADSVSCIFDFLANYSQPTLDNRAPSPFQGGFMGWFSYEIGSQIIHPVDSTVIHPDAFLLYVDRFIAIDHTTNRTYAVAIDEKKQSPRVQNWFNELKSITVSPAISTASPPQKTPPILFTFHTPEAEYIANIEKCRDSIREGDSYQVCLTNELTANISVDAFSLYTTMRHTNPTDHSAFIKFSDGHILCSSPEQFLQIDAQGNVKTKPIKGTTKRGKTTEEDAEIKTELLDNAKERAENVMIVDLLRNDLSKVCQTRSVTVPKLLDIETYETVHQLVSTVTGILLEHNTAYDALNALFPGGSMTGTPKKSTLKIIANLEGRNRGVYSGIIGWLGHDGACDFNIVIRTIVHENDHIRIGVGGGITYASNALDEFEEVKLKAHAAIFAVISSYYGDFNPSLFQIK